MDKIKTILLNHGEKIAAGIFVLFGLLALTSATYSPAEEVLPAPSELVSSANRAEGAIDQNLWPEAEQKVFLREGVTKVTELVKDESNKVTRAEQFLIGTFNPSTLSVRAKRGAIVLNAPKAPVASPFTMVLAMVPEEETEEEDGEDGDDKEEEMDSDSEVEASLADLIARKYKRNSTTGNGPGAGTLGGSEGAPSAAEMEEYESQNNAFGTEDEANISENMISQMGMNYDGEDDYGAGDLSGEYGQDMMSTTKRIRSEAAISARWVFDLQEQRRAIRKALSLGGNDAAAHAMIMFVDYKLERRKEIAPGEWDEWEEQNQEDISAILRDSFGLDQDLVSPAVTRNTVTMPLPRRAVGEWTTEEVSHPAIVDFVLDEKERQAINLLNQKVNEIERKRKEKEEKNASTQLGGFSNFVSSATDLMQEDVYSNSMSYAGGMGMGMESGGDYGSGGYGGYGDYGSAYEDFAGGGTDSEFSQSQQERIDETKITAEDRLLLVRIMDFTIERGFNYQYRVRLVMRNPNWGIPLDELSDPALANEKDLVSEWSEPTPPVMVEESHRTYLTGVEGNRGAPETVNVTVFTDKTDTGTPVMGSLRGVKMGLPVAGTQNMEVVDVTVERIHERDVTLETNEILLSAHRFEPLSASDHPGLRSIIQKNRGRLAADQICTVAGDGTIQLRFMGNGSGEMAQLKDAMKQILDDYSSWKVSEKTGENSFYGEGEDGGYGEGVGMSAASGASGGFYNGGGGGMGMGMMRGAAGAGMSGARGGGAGGGLGLGGARGGGPGGASPTQRGGRR